MLLLPDQIHAISSTASLERMENASVTMSCVFFKDPQDPDPFPQVTWTGPSYHSVETAPRMTSYDRYQSSITFTAKREHYGIFTCSVNDVGVGIINMTISLNIYCKCTDYFSTINAICDVYVPAIILQHYEIVHDLVCSS